MAQDPLSVGELTVRARALRIPLRRPTRISNRILHARDFLIVEVTRDGCTGTGYAYIGTSGAAAARMLTVDVLAPVLRGRDPDDILALWEAMFQESLLIGRRGIVLRAMSAIDMALWDLAAQRAGLPLAVLLGGAVRAIPAYASGGYYRADDPDACAAVRAEIRADRAAGFVDHKIKVGGASVEADAERVRSALDEMAGSGRLALDANNAYRTPAEAVRAAEAFEVAAAQAGANGLWWFEEPLSPEDIDGHAWVRSRIATPVATGEIAQTRHEFRALLDAQAADILQPDAGVLGGVTEYLRVVRAAELHQVPIAPHWHANVHAHLAAASTGCVAVEHFALDKDIYNFEAVVRPETRLAFADGAVEVPNRPGIGIALDMAAVERYEVAA